MQWLVGQTFAFAVIPTALLWVGLIAGRAPASESLPALVAAWAVSLATALGIPLAQEFLARPAALALAGAWLLLCASGSSAAIAQTAPWRLLTFPVSPALLATDEWSRFAVSFRAIGSVALFDVGLLAVPLALELRRDR